ASALPCVPRPTIRLTLPARLRRAPGSLMASQLSGRTALSELSESKGLPDPPYLPDPTCLPDLPCLPSPPQRLRNRRRDDKSRVRIGMPIPRQPPREIERHQHVRQPWFVEDSPPQRPLHRFLDAELRYHDQRRRAALTRELHDPSECFARHDHATLDRAIAAIGYEQSRERRQPPVRPLREPYQSRPEMRAVVIEIAAEERRHEQRDDGQRLTESRKLALKPQVRLVGAEAMDGQVCALDVQHYAGLRRNALVKREPFAEHHRFADEQ